MSIPDSLSAQVIRGERTLALLGGPRYVTLSARELSNPAQVRRMIQAGLPVDSAVFIRQNSGVPIKLFDRVVPRTTLDSASKNSSKRLSKPVSEAVLRAARIIALAEEAFCDRDRALNWLNTANSVFDNEAPITVTDTESGAEWVEQVLGRLMYGVDA